MRRTDEGLVAARGEIEVQRRTRTYLVVRRPGPVVGGPLVLALHGSNQDGATLRRFAGFGFDRYASDGGATVLYLDGYRRNWNDARRHSDFAARRDGVDDVAFVTALADRFIAAGEADADRVYAVGFSAGGSMVLRLVLEIPERLAGAAVLSAVQPVPDNLIPVEGRPHPVPMVFFHGLADPLVPHAGGMASLWGFRPRGLGLSAHETAAYYAARNGISTDPVVHPLPRAAGSDPTSIERLEYRQAGHDPVVLYSVAGGGHVVPGPKRAPRIMGRTSTRLDAPAEIGGFFGLLPPGVDAQVD